MDNLSAHKCVDIIKIMQNDNVSMILTPSNTPEFSPSNDFMFNFISICS